jgi:hypothetical protein
MIILLPKNQVYKIGSDFPLLTIPTEGENTQSGTFDDFQWWAYSKDFQQWLKNNPRQWVAESASDSPYPSLTELIKEKFDHPGINSGSIQNPEGQKKVASFDSFISSDGYLNEVESGQTASEDAEVKQAVKFHFAYNSLTSQGKIKDSFSPSELSSSSDSAVFLAVEDPESGESIRETLKGYKMRSVSTTADGSKIVLADLTEMVPGGKITEEDKPESIVQNALKSGLAIGTAGILGGGLYSAIVYGGSAIGGMRLLKTLSGFKKGKTTTVTQGGKTMKTLFGGIKNFGKFVKDTVSLKATRDLVSATTSGYKGFKAAGATTGSALKAAFGMSVKGGGKTASRLIPFVGEVLMVIDAVGSLWNWYSNNQAPRYKEVDSFAHNEMDPKKIPIGIPITICWSQPAQSTFGAIISFIASNDTRTTLEMIKIGEKEGRSIFILTQINSKSLQRQLAEHDLVLISLDNSEIVNDQGGFVNTVKRVFDNEDMDFKITYIDNLQGAASVMNFQGACDWEEFMSAYDSASDQMILSNPKAPDTYQFFYKDPDGDHINVSGKLVPSSDLKSTDSGKLVSMFFPSKDNKFQTKYTEEEKEEKVEDKIEAKTESEYNESLGRLISENTIYTSISDFDLALSKLDEAEGDADQQNLSAEDLTKPAEVMIYWVTEKVYANPELRKYALRGSKFTNFLIDEADVDARDGEAITVEVNTVGGVDPIDPKRGVYTFVPDEDDEEDVEGRKIQVQPDIETPEEDEEDEEKKDPIVTSPKDVKIRDRKNKIVIRDKSVSDGVNIMDEFLSDEDKKILGITDWRAITLAKGKKNKNGEIDEVVLRNRYAPLGRKTKKYRITDGEAFEVAKKFLDETDERIKYE